MKQAAILVTFALTGWLESQQEHVGPCLQAANALSKQKLDDDSMDTIEGFREELLSELNLRGPEVSSELLLCINQV